MKIALISSEAVPYSKTGGLADVAGTLFRELDAMGHDTALFVPLYASTKGRFHERLADLKIEIWIPIGTATKKCRVYSEKQPSGKSTGKGTVYFISNDEYFDRPELYGSAQGDYTDNDRRFIFFCRGVLEACRILGLKYDVLHCNDWQTSLIPLYLNTIYRRDPVFAATKTVLTIHNMGYQGLFHPSSLDAAGFGPEIFHPDGVEFYGKVNFLKAGLISADILTTVSPTYAKEILSPEKGFGLDGVLRKRAAALFGVLNGIDTTEWNPGTDVLLPSKYSRTDLGGKAECKRRLMSKCSLEGTQDTPLLSFIGRLSSQKGIDLLADSISELLGKGANLFILGKGDERFQGLLKKMASNYPRRVYFLAGFDEELAHLAYAGSDIFLMPSLYEPCGLGQMIAMRYGTIPVAYSTGGLADTIVSSERSYDKYLTDGNYSTIKDTGFLFNSHNRDALMAAVGKALSVFRQKNIWQILVGNAMEADFSWKNSAEKYLELYERPVTIAR
ncbi:MAG TPA: glycogen/starch synthase [Dissulfurispiraceae bacterium]|nr:glycogen/starch synthase [Dissulfurispiraceae bacterium]